MANQDDLSFIITFSQLLASAAKSVQHRLECLPVSILTWTIVLFGIAVIITIAFRLITRKKKPFKVGPFKVPAWVPFSTACISFVIILLFL